MIDMRVIELAKISFHIPLSLSLSLSLFLFLYVHVIVAAHVKIITSPSTRIVCVCTTGVLRDLWG